MLIDKTAIARDCLNGKVALITGAGQGIGRDTARILAHLGAKVIIAEINDTGTNVVNLVESDGGEALFVKTDVSEPLQMDFLKQKVYEVYGQVDILVNNAAHYVLKPVLDHTIEEWDRVIEVNLCGAFLGIKAFMPDMLRRGSGVIVTFQSVEGMPSLASYLATKAGLRSLASSLDLEIGKDSGVSVFCFEPGIVDTEGGGAALRKLAMIYGKTMQDLIAGNGGLISSELSATGLVGAVLHAADFHGQTASYSTGLGKLGMDIEGNTVHPPEEPVFIMEPVKTGSAEPTSDVTEDSSAVAVSPPNKESSTADSSTLVDSSLPVLSPLELNERLEEILEALIKEYDRMPMFMRPVARRSFQQRTGRKVDEWLILAQEMSRKLSSRKIRATYAGEYT